MTPLRVLAILALVLGALVILGPLSGNPFARFLLPDIALQGGAVTRDGTADVEAQLDAARLVVPMPRRQHAVVQFERAPTAAEGRAIEATLPVRFVGAIPTHAHIVGFPTRRGAEVLERLRNTHPPGRRFVALTAKDRLAVTLIGTPPLRRGPVGPINVPAHAEVATPSGAIHIDLRVRFFADIDLAEARRVLLKYGGPSHVPVDGLWPIVLDSARVVDLAGEDSVQFIEPAPGPGMNDLNEARAGLNLDVSVAERGHGVTIAQRELNAAGAHDAYKSRFTVASPAAPYAFSAGSDRHATLVAGILAGDGTGDLEYHGIAPAAQLRAYSIVSAISRHDQLRDAYLAGATLLNNSWGYQYQDHVHVAPGLYYPDLAWFYDMLSTGRDETGAVRGPGGRFLVAGSAGNLGDQGAWATVRIGNSAKNALAVGNVANEAGQPLWPACNSGRGPTADGRIAPTLVAPGGEIVPAPATAAAPPAARGIRSTATVPRGYEDDGGTSFSAPMITGAAALLTERLTLACGAPSPATLRALLVHTAKDLTDASQDAQSRARVPASVCKHDGAIGQNYAGPDYVFGWGLADVARALEVHGAFATDSIERGWIEYHVNLKVTDLEDGQLRATLVWDDPPYTPNAAPDPDTGILQNDLDLELVAPDGRRFLPWRLDAGNPSQPATRTSRARWLWVDQALRDHRNTIEQVVVDGAEFTPGAWLFRVRVHRMHLGPQTFTLVSRAFAAGSGCGSPSNASVVRIDWPKEVPSDFRLWLIFWIAVLILIGLVFRVAHALIPTGVVGWILLLLFIAWLFVVFTALLNVSYGWLLFWLAVFLALVLGLGP